MCVCPDHPRRAFLLILRLLRRRFLIQNDATAILHTGDVRADAPFTTRLRSHPAVQPFVRDACGVFDRAAAMSQDDGEDAQPRLERIYLDTAMLFVAGRAFAGRD